MPHTCIPGYRRYAYTRFFTALVYGGVVVW